MNLNTQNKVNVRRIELNNYRHRTWTHLCWSYSAHTGESKYYHNGAILDTEHLNVTIDDLALRASTEMSKYALILGQEQDEVGGGFQKGEAYIGHLSEFNIWNFTLSKSPPILKSNIGVSQTSVSYTHLTLPTICSV